jgi:hypothetical protein
MVEDLKGGTMRATLVDAVIPGYMKGGTMVTANMLGGYNDRTTQRPRGQGNGHHRGVREKKWNEHRVIAQETVYGITKSYHTRSRASDGIAKENKNEKKEKRKENKNENQENVTREIIQNEKMEVINDGFKKVRFEKEINEKTHKIGVVQAVSRTQNTPKNWNRKTNSEGYKGKITACTPRQALMSKFGHLVRPAMEDELEMFEERGLYKKVHIKDVPKDAQKIEIFLDHGTEMGG